MERWRRERALGLTSWKLRLAESSQRAQTAPASLTPFEPAFLKCE